MRMVSKYRYGVIPFDFVNARKVFALAGLCGICLYYLLENIALTFTMASIVLIFIKKYIAINTGGKPDETIEIICDACPNAGRKLRRPASLSGNIFTNGFT